MIPRPANRSARARCLRGGNLHQPRLESLAAEFALLTQRRAKAIHQIALLDQQRAVAATGFARLQHRIAWLVQRMDMLNPELREPAAAEPPEPEPPPPPPPPPVRKPNGLAAIGRQWAAVPPPTRPGKRL
jgi:hypothetical protein